MKRLIVAAVALAILIPISNAIAGSASSGSDIAFYDASSGQWKFEGGDAIHYGAPGDLPLFCDWNGDGLSTVGVYRDNRGYLLLSNSNRTSMAEHEFYYGIPDDVPLCGDWDGDGNDTIAIYRRSEGRFYLRNVNTQGFGDWEFQFGYAGGVPFAGDWDGDGVDTVGVRNPSNGFIEVATGNHDVSTALEVFFGSSNEVLVIGDWDADGDDNFGLFDPARRTLSITNVFSDLSVVETYQLASDVGVPLAGEWNLTAGVSEVASPVTDPDPVNQEGDLPNDPPPPDNSGGNAPSVPDTAPASKIVKPAIPVPGNAVRIDPGTNIQNVVNSHGEGTTFLLGSGVHRLQRVKPKNNQAFIGESGAVMSGARLLTSWQQDGGRWFVGGQNQEGRIHGDCEGGFGRCNRPEELFINDVRMRHVGSRDEVGPGKWYFDYGADRIYIGENPNGKRVETSVTENAFYGRVNGVTVTGLVVEKYATPAQVGAIDTRDNASGQANGSNWFIANNEVRNNHGVGVKSTDGAKVTGNYIHHNGQLGMGGDGANMLIENNEIAYNNAAHYAYGWEGGGTKWAFTRDLVVRGNYSHHNVGPGLWTDIDNIDTLYEGNRVMHNVGIGIFHEISYAATIRNNYIEGNGSGHSAWLWGAGIVVAASPNVEVYGNEVVNNADGIAAIQQNRSDAPSGYGPQEIKNLHVHDNVITMSEGHTGLVQDVGDDSYFTSRNNRFENNEYILNNGNRHFNWKNAERSLAEWNGFGLS